MKLKPVNDGERRWTTGIGAASSFALRPGVDLAERVRFELSAAMIETWVPTVEAELTLCHQHRILKWARLCPILKV